MTILGAMFIAFTAVFYIIIYRMEKETDELMREIYWTEGSVKNEDESQVHNVHSRENTPATNILKIKKGQR